MGLDREQIIRNTKQVFDFAASLIEKQIPMKAEYSSLSWYICPRCCGSISIENIQEHICEKETTYCEHCGQAIDWSESNGE